MYDPARQDIEVEGPLPPAPVWLLGGCWALGRPWMLLAEPKGAIGAIIIDLVCVPATLGLLSPAPARQSRPCPARLALTG